ncbi:MAG: alanine racemase, partial [Pseudomonadota bacterium]
MFRRIVQESDLAQAYQDTDEFLTYFDYSRFRNRVVLLKGARKFELEQIIPYLSLRVNVTTYRINLDALERNLRRFDALLRSKAPQASMASFMVMVKAFAYGSGSWEIARTLARAGVQHFAVAYLSEGIELRKKGTLAHIMVLNADPTGIAQLFHYRLTPVVYDLPFLKHCVAMGERLNVPEVSVHIKLDTGMRRLGFMEEDLANLADFVRAHPRLRVVGFMSHLAAADSPHSDSYTHQQLDTFHAWCDQLEPAFTSQGRARPLRHVLNTAGIIRFPLERSDLFRLGIGLYGISPVEGALPDLEEIGSLHTSITQVHDYPTGVSVGYGRSQFTERPSRIATVPIGYADGVSRLLSNGKFAFLVQGKRAPIFGRVC